ncbi:MAG: hypothetical protein AB4372_11685 [Xenococcus sp. (in: cyanobacteria)]
MAWLIKLGSSKKRNLGNSSSQNGNFGVGQMSGGEIKDTTMAGEINENNHLQSQNTSNNVILNINTQNKSNSSEKNNTASKKEIIELHIKEGEKEATVKAPYSTANMTECLKLVEKVFDIKVQDIEQGSIKFILKGSEKELQEVVDCFESGLLVELLKQKFNLELESVKLVDHNISDDYLKNPSQKLLAFTIAGSLNQADMDILKATLIRTSEDSEGAVAQNWKDIKLINSNLINNVISKIELVIAILWFCLPLLLYVLIFLYILSLPVLFGFNKSELGAYITPINALLILVLVFFLDKSASPQNVLINSFSKSFGQISIMSLLFLISLFISIMSQEYTTVFEWIKLNTLSLFLSSLGGWLSLSHNIDKRFFTGMTFALVGVLTISLEFTVRLSLN